MIQFRIQTSTYKSPDSSWLKEKIKENVIFWISQLTM